MQTTYLRFVVPARHRISQEPTGLFTAMYALQRQGELQPAELIWWRTVSRWFNKHLPAPNAAARSRRPHAPNRAIFWFKSSATEHVSRMREIATILEAHGVTVEVLQSARPGYVVYEDAFQVAADPFRGVKSG
jgi:hypothetical protein